MKVRVCPICLSPKIKKATPFDGWLIPETYVCEDCGYRGPIYLELEIEEGELDRHGDWGDTG